MFHRSTVDNQTSRKEKNVTVSLEGGLGADDPRLSASLYMHPKVRVLKLSRDGISFWAFAFLEYRRDDESPRAITRDYLKERGGLLFFQIPDAVWYGEDKTVNTAATAFFYDQHGGSPEYVLRQII